MQMNPGRLAGDIREAREDTPADRLRRGGGWLALLLALLMLGTLTRSLAEANWSDGLSVVHAAILGGAVIGFALALTRWDGFFPTFYSLLASIVWITMLCSNSLLPSLSLHDGVEELINRNLHWLGALVAGAPSADNLIFVIQLSYLAWWIGYFAIWSIFRHQKVMHAVLPAGIGLLINAYYASQDLGGYLVVFLIAVVLIAIRVELARNEDRWQLFHIRYAPDIYIDFLRAGLVFAVAVTALAWTLPGLADRTALEKLLRPFEGPWHTITDTWSRMYRDLNYQGPAAVISTFGKSMTLGGPVNLTDRPIFEAFTPQTTYWRGAVYDYYTGQTWLNTDSSVSTLDRDQPLGEPPAWVVSEITATIRVLQNADDVIYVPPQPLRVSLPLTVDETQVSDEPAERTVSLLRSRLTLVENSTYQVSSAVTAASPEELRAAGTTYPEWVLRRYLEVPDTLPERVRAFARTITEDQTNPYDMAFALEQRLRQYEYNQHIAAPPEGADAVDYFLFQAKEGYCDYYASAMIIMLRSVGVPARLAAGYSPGQLIDPEDGIPRAIRQYQIQERNAHAWVEVYFPTFGWIQFEPTASEPMLARPEARPSVQPAESADQSSDALQDELDDLRPDRGAQLTPDQQAGTTPGAWLARRWKLAVAFAAAIIALVAAIAVNWRRWSRMAQHPALIPYLFGALSTWAGRLRIAWPASHTPLEHAGTFSARIPETTTVIQRLASVFTAQLYGHEIQSAETLAETAEEWQRIQPLFWKRWLRVLLDLPALWRRLHRR